MQMQVNAQSRTTQGKGASRRLRAAGKVPGILYGADQEAKPIELSHHELFQQLKSESFHASILTMDLDGNQLQVLLRDVQMHPWRREVLHADFQRVAADREVMLKVPLHFVNQENCPGVKLAGGIVSHVMTEVEVACLPRHLPEYLEVDLGQLQVGHSLHLSSVKLPEGVRLPQLPRNDATVATVTVPRAVVEEEAAAVATPPAAEKKEPEKKDAGKK
jgi:large subunit ribosomal protein L25